jgi:hypothetical protein
MKVAEFFKTEKGLIVGVGVIGGILIGFGADVGIATFWVTGIIMVIASAFLAITAWVKHYD